MNFELKKKEIILISLLGLLIYALVMYKFIWVPVVPEIGEQKNKIVDLQSQKKDLEADLQNLDAKKTELASKTAGNERLAGYLSNETNVTDCVEYMDKLAKIVGSEITGVSIAAPEKKETGAATYYEIKIDFNSKAPINKIMDMVSYIEGSSRVMKIENFHVTEEKEQKDAAQANNGAKKDNQANQANAENKKYKAAVALSMYALNIEAADKIYEYGRHKFNRYEYGTDQVFRGLNPVSTNSVSQGKNGTPTNIINSRDFEINLNSFLTAGDNFIIQGLDKSKDKLSLKTNKYLTMDMSIANNSVALTLLDGTPKSYNLNCDVPNRALNMFINVNLSQIAENKNLGLKLIVRNNSQNNLNVTLDDISRKVRLFGRDGKEIKDGSNNEKIIII